MTLKKALSVKSLFLGLLAVFLTGVIAWGFIFIRAPFLPGTPSQGKLAVFSAPSQLPAGEHWVLVGSFTDLPKDFTATPLAPGVLVLEVERLSPKAYGVRIQVPAAAAGKLLRVSSDAEFSAADLELYLGGIVPPLVTEANFQAKDFIAGHLVIDGLDFTYGYFPKSPSPLAALRIFNRQSGIWYRHEPALEKARVAAEPKEIVGANFVAVDPLVTLPDTDGDQVYDFAEAPEVKDPVPEQLGVELLPGMNLLDIVSADEAGNVAWKSLAVFSTSTGK